MRKIDALSKKLMNDNEVFADAFNFLLYNGEQKIKPEDLKPLDTNSISVEINNKSYNRNKSIFFPKTRQKFITTSIFFAFSVLFAFKVYLTSILH